MILGVITAFSYLAQALRQARIAKNLSQVELARKLGVTQTTISRAESGRDMRVATLVQIARALDLEPLLAPRSIVPAINALVGSVRARRHPLVHAADDDRLYSEDIVVDDGDDPIDTISGERTLDTRERFTP